MNKVKSEKRWRLVADPKIQVWLCFRVVAYWVICQITILGTFLAFAFLENGSHGGSFDIWNLVVKSLVVSALVIPVIIYDMLSFSNRFVGPVHNFRNKMKQLVETGETSEIVFRKGDFYPDLRENMNELVGQIAAPTRTMNDENQDYVVAGGSQSR
jgi:hypothetical protein